MKVSGGITKKIPLILVLIIIIGLLAFLSFDFLFSEEPNNWLQDPEGDVSLSIGDEIPGIIDLNRAGLELNDDQVMFGITTKDSVLDAGQNEVVKFDVLLVFQNESDTLYTFRIQIEFNSTGTFSFLTDLGTEIVEVQELSFDQNSITAFVDLTGYELPSIVEWSVSSRYEEIVGEESVTVADDFVPDEGLHTTFLTDE